MPRLRILPQDITIEAEAGLTLVEAAKNGGVPIAIGCGVGFCGLDQVRVIDGLAALDAPGATEIETLKDLDAPENIRLACSAKLKGDCTIELLDAPAVLTDHKPHFVSRLDRYKVLLVDLSNEQLAIFRAALASHACGVDVVSDGVDGKARLRQTEYQLLGCRVRADQTESLDSGRLVLSHLKLYGTKTDVVVILDSPDVDLKTQHRPPVVVHPFYLPINRPRLQRLVEEIFG